MNELGPISEHTDDEDVFSGPRLHRSLNNTPLARRRRLRLTGKTPVPQPSLSRRASAHTLDFVLKQQSLHEQNNDSRGTRDIARRAAIEIHEVLYGRRDGVSIADVNRTVHKRYLDSAAYENFALKCVGPSSIAALFSMIRRGPGELYSELLDVTQSSLFDGRQIITISHVIHFTPFYGYTREDILACAPSDYHYTGPTDDSALDSPIPTSLNYCDSDHVETDYASGAESSGATFRLKEKVYSASVSTETHWNFLAEYLLKALQGLASIELLKVFTIYHFKVRTSLVFTENGQIITHDDTYGVMEVTEGLFPLFAPLYRATRRGTGLGAYGIYSIGRFAYATARYVFSSSKARLGLSFEKSGLGAAVTSATTPLSKTVSYFTQP